MARSWMRRLSAPCRAWDRWAARTGLGESRCRSSIRPCPPCSASSGARGFSCPSSAPIPRRSRMCSSRSREGSCAMAERGWLAHPLVQLTLVRYREFYREPEAIFWVFIFPVLLTAGLGIAFRSRAPDRIPIALVEHHAGPEVAARLGREDGLKVRTLPDSAAAQALRAGDVAVIVVTTDSGVEYRYDPARPDAREARLRADEAVQRAAGRSDPVPAHERMVSQAASRYVDFVVPGLLGMNLMG